jgi:hypothetical protein
MLHHAGISSMSILGIVLGISLAACSPPKHSFNQSATSTGEGEVEGGVKTQGQTTGPVIINSNNGQVTCETEHNIIEISTEEELQAMRDESSYKLKNNIQLTKPFNPIQGFAIFLDGGGFTVSNLRISSTVDKAGLFSVLTGGCIKNINFTGAVVTGKNKVGIAMGESGASPIFNVKFADSTVSGNDHVGGLVGVFTGRGTPARDIEGRAITVNGSGEMVGGVIGYHGGGGVVALAENIVVTNMTVTGRTLVGGITGKSPQESKNLRATSVRVTAQGDQAGGISGSGSYGGIKIDGCYVDGEVKAQNYGAGVVGKFNGGGATIKNCESAANVEISGEYAGGIVGHITGGSMSLDGSKTSGNIRGANFIGGVAGHANGGGKQFNSISSSARVYTNGTSFGAFGNIDVPGVQWTGSVLKP